MFAQFRWLAVALLAASLGCRSLSPEDDLRDAAEHLEPRVGFAPEWAEAPPDSELSGVVGLERVVRHALRHHPELRVAVAEVAAARADLVRADLLPNPVVNLAVGIPIDGGGGSPGSYGVIQQLAALWQRPAKLAAAEAELRAKVLVLCDRSVALAADVGRAMAMVQHGRRQLELAARDVELSASRVELVEGMAQAGEATRDEVNAVVLDFARARQREVDAREQRDVAERTLLERLGAAGGSTAGFELDFSSLPSLEAGLPEENVVRDLVATQRLDVVAAFTAIDGAGARARIAAWQRWPDVSVGAKLERNFQRREGVFPNARVTLPIFDSGGAAIARAEAIERRSEAEAQRILLAAIREARVAHVALSQARERRVRIAADALPATRETHELALQSFQTGEETLTRVLRAEAELIRTELRYDAAALAERLAHFDLVEAAGGSLEPITELAAKEVE